MHYLSHYYFDRQVKAAPYLLGLVLPDLARSFDRNLRFRELTPSFDCAVSKQIQRGINRHHQVDHYFHNAPFFTTHTQLIKSVLKKTKFEHLTKYHYFLAHILLEMLLDKYLLYKEADLADNFYHSLSQIRLQMVSSFFKTRKLDINEAAFYQFLQKFTHSRYIFHYRKHEGIAYGLERLFTRITNQEITKPDRKKLLDSIQQSDEALLPFYPEVYQEMSRKLSAPITAMKKANKK